MKALKDVMTGDVEMVFPHTTVREAAAKMKKLDIGMLPVCDGDRLTGVITDRDIVIRAVSQNCNPEQTLVRDIMTHDLIYSYEDEPIRSAADLMRERQIRRLIVLDRHKKLSGVVSIGDLAVETNKRLAGVTLRAVSQPSTTTSEKLTGQGILSGLTRLKGRPLATIGTLLGTAITVGALRALTRHLPEERPEELIQSLKPSETRREHEATTRPTGSTSEQESHESGIVSPIKNEIVAEHGRLHPAGDPAVRRINPSREIAGVRTVRRPFFGGKERSQTGR